MKQIFKPGMAVLGFIFGIHPLHSQWLGMDVKEVIPTQQRFYNLKLAHTNKDSFTDIVALPVEVGNTLHIFRSNGERFSSSASVSKEENYRVLEAGDLNADGVDDLVMAAYWNNGFKIFWGDENGGYTEGEYYALTGHGKNVKVADLNQDDAPDVIALSGGSGQPITLHVFYGNKTKVLTPGGIYRSLLDTDRRITVVDKNQDGLPDIMVASSFPYFVIFYQQSNGSFIPRYWPYAVEIPFTSDYYLADLDNDTRQDIIANYPDEGLRFYAGKADTLFSETYSSCPLALRPFRLATADLNKDGFTDILMDHHKEELDPTDTLYYLLGHGDLTFDNPRPIVFPSAVENFVTGDLNNDTFTDVVAYCRGQGIVTVMNGGTVTGTTPEPPPARLFPNPFTDRLNIEAPDRFTQVIIHDSQGRTIRSLADGAGQLDTTSWSAGLYLVRIVKDKKVWLQKIVRQ